MRKITQSFFALAVAFAATCSAAAQTVITELSQLSDSKTYTLVAPRAALDASTDKFTNSTADASSTAQQFAIHKYGEGTYVVYSLSKSQFLTKSNNKGVFTNYPTTQFTLTAAKTDGRWIFKHSSSSTRINIGSGNDLFIDGWSDDDDGNQFEITEVSDLDEATKTAVDEIVEKEKTNNVFTNQINTLDQLSNNKAYYVFNARGAWAYSASDNPTGLTSTQNATEHFLDNGLKTFALLKSARGNYYAYNVAAKMFVGKQDGGTTLTTTPSVAGNILNASEGRVQVGTPWVFDLNGNQLNITPSFTEKFGIITSWNDVNDEGNAVGFMEAGDFDATEAMAAIDAFEAENDFLTDSITPRSGYTFSQVPEVKVSFTTEVECNTDNISIKKDGQALPEGINAKFNTENKSKLIINLVKAVGENATEEPVTDEGVYTIHIPYTAITNQMGIFLDKDIDLTYNINANGPAEALALVDIAPAELSAEKEFETFPEITLTFNREVSIDNTKQIKINTMFGSAAGAKVSAQVSSEDAKKVILTTTGADETGNYIINIPSDIFVDQYGQGNDATDIEVAIAAAANTLTVKEITPAENEPVKELDKVTIEFNDEVGLLREDKIESIELTNGNGENLNNEVVSVDYPFDIDGQANYTKIIIYVNLKKDGTYTFTLPEGLVYNYLADDSAEDYGVSMGATYNPEITFSVTIDTTTGINTIKATTKDGKAIYNLKGVKVNKAAHGVFIVNGKKQIVK